MRRRLPAALRERDYARLVAAVVAMGFGREVVLVAVGWQVYGISRNPLHLGLVGLAEFLPLPLLALPAGALADRLSRKLVYIASLAVDAVITALLLVVSLSGADSLWPFLALSFASGVAAALGNPAVRAMPPTLVPLELLTSALAIRSTVGQATVVTGPAIGGVLFAVRPELAYGTGIALFLLAMVAAATIRPRLVEQAPELAGSRLGGLGVLRSAPAVGALAAGIMLTRRPLRRHTGRTLLVVVGVFGASMVVFGLSRSFTLSLVALAVSGFADMISMNIRATITALATPDALLGRVNAVEMVFISASNELGAFESGAAGALPAAAPPPAAGGCLTIAAALLWPRVFRPLAHIDRLESLRPAAGTSAGGSLH